MIIGCKLATTEYSAETFFNVNLLKHVDFVLFYFLPIYNCLSFILILV